MRIKRTYKETSLKFGTEEIISKEKVMEIFGQTDTYDVHGNHLGSSIAHPAFFRLYKKRGIVETFFSRFELISA